MGRSLDAPMPTDTLPLYVTSFRGIGAITLRELRDRCGPAVQNLHTHTVRDYDLTGFDFSGAPETLLDLRTIEDLFYRIGTLPLSGAKTDLNALQHAPLRDRIEPGLALHRALRPRQRRKRPAFRVIVQAADAPWRAYRRPQIQDALEKGLASLYKRWKPVPDDAHLEFWFQQTHKQALLGLRLTDRTTRHRTYKTASLPASLRPTLAAALVYLSDARPTDVFLDPTCGAGTLLLERALAGRHGLLLGGDIRPEAIRCTLENFGPRHKPRHICRWDAACLPLRAASIDRLCANLPWGRQIGSPAENRRLYAGLLEETARILKPGGRAVYLTGDARLFRTAQSAVPELRIREHIRRIAVLGQQADIFVLEKAPV